MSTVVVVTPATNRALASLSDIKAELEITDTSKDTILSTMIIEESKAAEVFCKRVFATETVRETIRQPAGWYFPAHRQLHGQLPSQIVLTRWPVVSIASITEDGTAIAPTDYEADNESGSLLRLSASTYPISWTARAIVVQYTAGYALPADSAPNLPEDIQRAVKEMVKLRFFARGRDPLVRVHSEPGLGSSDYWVGPLRGQADYGMPSQIAAMLEPYRRVVV